MSNKILSYLRSCYKPIYYKLIKYGWDLRLLKRKRILKFIKLTNSQKKEIKEYWKKYGKTVSTDWVSFFYTMSGIYDKKYIPESLYYSEIQPFLNNQEVGWVLSDKNIASQIFNAEMPKTIGRKINNIFFDSNYNSIEKKYLISHIKNEGEVIIKPANNTYGGDGIKFWNSSDDITVLADILSQNSDFIVQEIVQQHKELAKYHPDSLNTIRIVTLQIGDGYKVLNSILRMGVNKSKVDNYSAGGVIANIDKDGNLYPETVQSSGKKIRFHPNSKIQFEGEKIPFFESIVNDAIMQHKRIPYFRMVSWDYSLSIEGKPVLIEGNYPSGQLDLHQINIGSLFGEYTDSILAEVYKK